MKKTRYEVNSSMMCMPLPTSQLSCPNIRFPKKNMPPKQEDLVIMRILVRHGFSRDLADLLTEDLKRCIDYYRRNPLVNKGNEDDSGGFNHS